MQVDAFRERIRQRGSQVGDVEEAEWGKLTHVVLPGGGKLGIYQPKHAKPDPVPP